MKIKICPKCKAHNTESAILCAECYASLNGVAPVEDTGERPAKRVKICPKCGAENGATAVICGSCYASLTDVVPTDAATVSAPQFKTCPNCGTQNAVGATRCKTCYKPFEEQAISAINTNEPPPNDVKNLLGISFLKSVFKKGESFDKYTPTGFSYKNFCISKKDIEDIKNLVCKNIPFVLQNDDYNRLKNDTYIFYNETFSYKEHPLFDKDTANAFACLAKPTARVYKVTPPLEKYIIVVLQGLAIAITISSAIYMKCNPCMVFENPDGICNLLRCCKGICFGSGSNLQALQQYDEQYGLIPDDEEKLFILEGLVKGGLTMVALHELGHIISGHVTGERLEKKFGSEYLYTYSRNQERDADRFAINATNSIYDSLVREYVFLGGIMHNLWPISFGGYGSNLSYNETDTHPASVERFRMILEGCKDLQEKYAITEEKYKRCIPVDF